MLSLLPILATITSIACIEAAEPPPTSQTRVPQPPTVVLHDPGLEPRQALRYRLQAGEEFATEMSMRTRGGELRDLSFAATVPGRIKVHDVDEDSARYDMTFDQIRFDEVPDEFREMGLVDMMGSATRDVRHRIRVDHRGRVIIAGRNLPTLPGQVFEVFKSGADAQSSFPVLPEEAVGPGARWMVSPASEGFTITYTLLSIEGDDLRLAVSSDMIDAGKLAAMPTDDVKIDFRLIGDAHVLLTEPMPRRLKMRFQMEMMPSSHEHPTPDFEMSMEMLMTSKRIEPESEPTP